MPAHRANTLLLQESLILNTLWKVSRSITVLASCVQRKKVRAIFVLAGATNRMQYKTNHMYNNITRVVETVCLCKFMTDICFVLNNYAIISEKHIPPLFPHILNFRKFANTFLQKTMLNFGKQFWKRLIFTQRMLSNI